MRRRALGLAAVGVGGAAAVTLYATVIEPRWIETTHPRIHIRRLPAVLEGLRIALLTDMHAGGGRSLARVRAAVRLALAARPHLVALAGDFAADDAPGFDRVFDALAPLRAPLGVYAVPGNHEYVVGIERWRESVARQRRIHDLTNRAVTLNVGDARLCVAGVDDYYAGEPTLKFLPPPDRRDVTILLAHGPDQAEQLRRCEDAVDLVLSGHTHGGQVRLPLMGAPLNSSDNPELYEQGLRRRPWTQVYTSRGIGTVHLPIRFLARPEVAILELTAAARPRARRRVGRRKPLGNVSDASPAGHSAAGSSGASKLNNVEELTDALLGPGRASARHARRTTACDDHGIVSRRRPRYSPPA